MSRDNNGIKRAAILLFITNGVSSARPMSVDQFLIYYIFLQCSPVGSGVFKGEGGTVRCPPTFGPTMKIFYRRFYMKRCVFAIFQQKLQNSQQCLMVFFSYRYNMRLKSSCETASDMTRRRRRVLLKTSCKPYRPIIFRSGRV